MPLCSVVHLMNETGTTMSSEWSEQPAAAPENNGAPGKVLAAQREALGWTVEQVAEQLKLAVRQVVALEAGDYSALPGPAVVRGFVRAYAKVVKLDAAPLVAQIPLDEPVPQAGATLRRDKPASFSEVRFPTHGRRSQLPLLPIAVIVIVVAALAAAWHFGLIQRVLNRGEAPAASSPAPAVLPPNVSEVPVSSAPAGPAHAAASPAASLEANALQNPSVPLISVPPPATAAADSPAAAATVTAVGPAPQAPAAKPASANALEIAVREDSWVEVRRAKGAPLISRLVKGGSTETFEISEPVTLVVGKPTAVNATLRGASVELTRVAGSTISRVNLK
jgi:cytoskeleton protein RodZ